MKKSFEKSPNHIFRRDTFKGVIGKKQVPGDSSRTMSDKQCRIFIEEINEGVYETDIYGNFSYFNNAFCKVLGYSEEEILGQNFSKFMDSKNSRVAFEAFTKIWETQERFTDLVLDISDSTGETRTIELSAHLIVDGSNDKQGFHGIARDVTRKFKNINALKESELRYQQEYEASRRAEKWASNLLDFVPYPMVVFTLDGNVDYLNASFTEVFGWTLGELKGRRIPYIPPDLEEETGENIKKLFDEKIVRMETRRLTKDGRVLDVILRAAVYTDDEDGKVGEVVILRDITHEKRMERNNRTLFRISMALPSYPALEDLLDYISEEIKHLLDTEGALVMLVDKDNEEIFFQGAAYDDSRVQKKVKKIRFPADKGVSGNVIRTGEPVIVPDTAKNPDFYPVVDQQLHLPTRNMVIVPLRSGDKIIGVLNALNKKQGSFDDTDRELLTMIAATVSLSIENARFSKEIKDAYQEVTSLNRAKDKVINHLSHELKTPVSVLLASLNILTKRLEKLPDNSWDPTMKRARRNLERILDIQYEVEDIMRDRAYVSYPILSNLLEQCADELEVLAAEEVGEGQIIERIRERIDEIFLIKESETAEIALDSYVQQRLEALRPSFAHRNIEIIENMEKTPSVCIPSDVLQKVIDGLLKNAVENCPDNGKIELSVHKSGEVIVHDYGVGITSEDRKRIFEGFFTTQETMDYSSKRPFDFNAGGKGADLLRIKIFSERHGFKVDMDSERCGFIPKESDICPGDINRCSFCNKKEDCYNSGGTVFTLYFPSAPEGGCFIASPL